MKVLLAVTDLFRDIGGGQTVYRRIIDSSPNIQFDYLLDHESCFAERPVNAHGVPLAGKWDIEILSHPPFPNYRKTALNDADRIARSVTGRIYDIVELPDYFCFGSVLRDALVRHSVIYKRLVLAMHGNISTSMEMNWGSPGDNVLEQKLLERDQFFDADGVYSISQRYIREWTKIVQRKVHYIDPIHFVDIQKLSQEPERHLDHKPSLYCIGRTERRKGNDLFVEIVRWLRPGSFSTAAHVGDIDTSNGVPSSYILEGIAEKRNIRIEYKKSLDKKGLSTLFAARSLIILPVRYDSLNLVTLEALFAGCPVAVSDRAGVCDYLDDSHPGLPYVKICYNDLYSSIPSIQSLLDNYDVWRERLAKHLASSKLETEKAFNFEVIYQAILDEPSRKDLVSHLSRALSNRNQEDSENPPKSFVSSVNGDDRQLVNDEIIDSTSHIQYRYEPPAQLLDRLAQRCKSIVAKTLKRRLHPDTYNELRSLVKSPRSHLRSTIKKRFQKTQYLGDDRIQFTLDDVQNIPKRLNRIANGREYNLLRLREKLDDIYGASSSPIFRCNFWADIARIERILENDLVAVTYELRLMRLLGCDLLGLLPKTTATLRKAGLYHEADAAEAMYGDPKNRDLRVYEYLIDTYQRLKNWTKKQFEHIDDRRNGDPKVAIIVSLYRAESKLRLFLSTIIQQTLNRSGLVELILIDSGSPTDEQRVFLNFIEHQSLNAVFARSKERETIQAAWNRGISLAKAPYLVFLGVDETLYPEALEVLANKLDSHPGIDWVMSNSLVTAVDNAGIYKNDIMTYDRTGATKNHAYLETCFISFVGGMYRKSIHERFGFYDESFTGAGDTEFKCRILPYIHVAFIQRTLGIFLNYPDDRTTASSKVEIEDLRAWYIHRTPGGIQYAFLNKQSLEAEQLLHLTMGYRKSYCGHTSCDIEYGSYLADFIIRKRESDSKRVMSTQLGLDTMLSDMRSLEFMQNIMKRRQCREAFRNAWRRAVDLQKLHISLWGMDANPQYLFFNDNRYEQHSWLWKTSANK